MHRGADPSRGAPIHSRAFLHVDQRELAHLTGDERAEDVDGAAEPVGVGHDGDPLERTELVQAEPGVRQDRTGLVALEPVTELQVEADLPPAGRGLLDRRVQAPTGSRPR